MAFEILNSQKFIRFDCIDTWRGSPEHNLEVGPFFVPELISDQDYLHREFLRNIAPVAHVIRAIRSPSLEASKLYLDRSIDFVFIDADHSYESVRADIAAWFPKVKRGGVIAGDDYGGAWYGVKRAVDEYFNSDLCEEEDFCVHECSWIYYKR